jgi:hypothetical protein
MTMPILLYIVSKLPVPDFYDEQPCGLRAFYRANCSGCMG